MKKLLLNSSLFRVIERIVVVLTSLLLTPYLISVLGTEDYGLWVLVLSIMGWFNVVDLGFPQAVQRQIIHALETRDYDRVNVVFSTGLVLFSALGLLAVIILAALTQVPSIFGVTGPNQITLVNILLVLSVKVLWGFMMNPFHGFFAGMLRFDIDANLSSLNAVAKALLVFWLISDLNIWGAVVATMVADVITNTMKVFYAKKLFSNLKFSKKLASHDEIKGLFSYSKHLILNGIITTVGKQAGPMIIVRIFDLSSLAIQQIALNLNNHVKAFVSTITGVFSPVYNKMVATGKDLEKIYKLTTTINLFVACILYSGLLAFGEKFIILWVGPKFDYAIYILSFMTIAMLCNIFTLSANNILLAQANHKLLSLISFFTVAISIPLSIYLASIYGLVGLAMAGALTQLVFSLYSKMALFKRYNKFKNYGTYRKFFTTVVLVYFMGFSGAEFLNWFNVDSWVGLIVSAVFLTPVIIFISWFSILDKEIKDLTIKLLMDKVKFLR